MNDNQAIEYVEQQGLTWEDRSEIVRHCTSCDKWVDVDKYNGTYDGCDDCVGE